MFPKKLIEDLIVYFSKKDYSYREIQLIFKEVRGYTYPSLGYISKVLTNKVPKYKHDQTIAGLAIKSAIEKGFVKKLDKCEQCGKSPTEGHHYRGYTRPLDVIWLCHGCHRKAENLKKRKK